MQHRWCPCHLCWAKNSGAEAIETRNPLRRPTRVLAVDDFEPYRLFVTTLLKERPELQVVCEVSCGLEAVEKAQELKPDLILMAIGLPGLNGIEAARRIRKLAPNSKIVFLTQESSAEVVEEAIRLGACGYVAKSEIESDLLVALETVLEGKQFVSKRLLDRDGARGNGNKAQS